jgi:CRP/FNR family transcriptional regulator
MNPSPQTWQADVRSRFNGIFEDALLNEVVEHGHHMRVPEGTMLMDVGQEMDAVPLLLNGAIKIMRLDPEGDEILLYFLESGDSCALSMGTYMGATKSSIRAVTERETSLVMVPVSVGQRWMKSYASWSAFVMESYQTRLEEMLDAIDALAFMDLPTRLRRYLSDKVKIQGDMTLHTTHQEIANDLHTSRVVVSRLLKSLERDGVLSLHRNAVEMNEY